MEAGSGSIMRLKNTVSDEHAHSLLSGVTAALLMGCGDTAPPVSFPWKQLSDSNTAQVERNFDPA